MSNGDFDIEKVMAQDERKSGIILSQRIELEALLRMNARLKAENETVRESIGVLRARALMKTVSEVQGEVVTRQSWHVDGATYRLVVLRIPAMQGEGGKP